MLTTDGNAPSVFRCNKCQCLAPCLTHNTATQTHNNNNNMNNNMNNNNNNNNVSHNNNTNNVNGSPLQKQQQQPHDEKQKFHQNSPEKCQHRKNAHTLFLEFLDVFLSCAIVAPCVIAYWRGTWELMGVLIFPKNSLMSALISFLIGGFGHLLFTMMQHFLRRHVHPDKRRLTYYVISRCYTAVFGVVCVNMWRGSWVLCDVLTSVDSLVIICVVTMVALIFLVATRTLRNLAAAPYTVAMDNKIDYFDVDTMFKIPGFHQPSLYILDTLFSVLVIGSLVVIAWRGVWGIMDLTLYRGNAAKSAWGSLIIGYVTVIFTFVIQPLMRWICHKIEAMLLLRLIICDIYYFLSFFGAVNCWRGIWNLLDVYLYPDNKVMSYWITHVIPFLILAALKCSNSILVRGVFIDADGTADECVEIPIHYIRLHFERERVKKRLNPIRRQSDRFQGLLAAENGAQSGQEKQSREQLLEKPPKGKACIVAGMNATGGGEDTKTTSSPTQFV